MNMRKGFTLVELLIVIVIIGILAAAMLLSSSTATASAEASSIVADLRGLKAAALMLYADSMDEFNDGTATPTVAMLGRYMDNPVKAANNYAIDSTTVSGKWFITCDLTNRTAEVKDKLKGRAKSTGLLQGPGALDAWYNGGATVAVVAR